MQIFKLPLNKIVHRWWDKELIHEVKRNYAGCHLKTVDSNPYMHNGYLCLPCVGIGWGVQAVYACCTYLTFNSRTALWQSLLGMFFSLLAWVNIEAIVNETIQRKHATRFVIPVELPIISFKTKPFGILDMSFILLWSKYSRSSCLV